MQGIVAIVELPSSLQESVKIRLAWLTVWFSMTAAFARSAQTAERLAQLRNLGKAFYEDPTTPNEAVTQFKRSLELAPDSVRRSIS